MLAIGITTVVYLMVAIITGFVVVRDAPGPPNDYFNETLSGMFNFTCGMGGNVVDETLYYCSNESYNFSTVPAYCPPSASLSTSCMNVSCDYGNATNENFRDICMSNPNTCGFGLLNYFQVSGRRLLSFLHWKTMAVPLLKTVCYHIGGQVSVVPLISYTSL